VLRSGNARLLLYASEEYNNHSRIMTTAQQRTKSVNVTPSAEQSRPSLSPELAERIRAALSDTPNRMTLQMARDFGVPEADIIRCFPDGRAVELDVGRWEEIVRSLEALGTVHVIVSNGCVTSEVVGQFGKFSTWGEFFNVQSKTIDMHIRWAQIGAAFAVEKPGHLDGINTLSVQFYDRAGVSAFKVFLTFGGSAPPPERVEQFSRIRSQFRLCASNE
jgi:putative heme iron utilization protein